MESFLQSPQAQLIAFVATVLGGIAAAIQLIGWALDFVGRVMASPTAAKYSMQLHRTFYFLVGTLAIGTVVLFVAALTLFPVVILVFDESSRLGAWIAWSGYGLAAGVAVLNLMGREMKVATIGKMKVFNITFSLLLAVASIMINLPFSERFYLLVAAIGGGASGVIGVLFFQFMVNIGKSKWEW